MDEYQEICLNTEFRQWNSLLRNMMESPLPVSIKTSLLSELEKILWGTILCKSRWPNNSLPSVILTLDCQSYVVQCDFILTEEYWNIFHVGFFSHYPELSHLLKTSRRKESRMRLTHSVLLKHCSCKMLPDFFSWYLRMLTVSCSKACSLK